MVLRLILISLVLNEVSVAVFSWNQICERKLVLPQVLMYGKQLLELYEDLRLPATKDPSNCSMKLEEKSVVFSVLAAMKPLKKYFLKTNDTSSLSFEELNNNCVCIKDLLSTHSKPSTNQTVIKKQSRKMKTSKNQTDANMFRNKRSRFIRVRRFAFNLPIKKHRPSNKENPLTKSQNFGPGTKDSDLSVMPTATQNFGPGTKDSDLSARPTATQNFGPGSKDSDLSAKPTATQNFGPGSKDSELAYQPIASQNFVPGSQDSDLTVRPFAIQNNGPGAYGELGQINSQTIIKQLTEKNISTHVIVETSKTENTIVIGGGIPNIPMVFPTPNLITNPTPFPVVFPTPNLINNPNPIPVFPTTNMIDKQNPRSCAEHQNVLGATANGIYYINLDGVRLSVYCDLLTDGGGWTVFQKRANTGKGKLYFYQTWSAYKYGFGEVGKDYWLGNEYLHKLTTQEPVDLRVDLVNFYGLKAHATYSNFSVGDEASRYTMTHGPFLGGNAGDSLGDSGLQFTTHDAPAPRIHRFKGKTCAQKAEGAWWYNTGHEGLWCYQSNLNGPYYDAPGKAKRNSLNVIVWEKFRSRNNVVMETEMKIRPSGFLSSAKQ